jgi:Xaa-Pro aminopeptidase
MSGMDLAQIQEALRAAHLDGWLFFDHHRRDPLAYRILAIPAEVSVSRRWYYFIPAKGDPRKLVHKIESGSLDSLPGSKQAYSSWSDQQGKLKDLLAGAGTVAMQYSPLCAIPYVSMVDAGTYELVAETGVEIVSSADLVQQFDSLWTKAQFEMHMEAGKRVDQARREAFDFVGERIRAGEAVTEYEVQQFMCMRFAQLDLTHDHGPTIAVNANASDPHYEPSESRSSAIAAGDVLLIDCFAKLNKPSSVYYDITWTGFCGDSSPGEVNNVFSIVRDARKAASRLVMTRIEAGHALAGFEVDDTARSYITEQGFGDYFIHRTGHSIGEEVHGTGANMDNLESHDIRRIVAGSCFSVEPGIYLPLFGIRSEINMFVTEGRAFVTGEEQEKLILI